MLYNNLGLVYGRLHKQFSCPRRKGGGGGTNKNNSINMNALHTKLHISHQLGKESTSVPAQNIRKGKYVNIKHKIKCNL